MKQINNTKTGQVIRLDKVKWNLNQIVYSLLSQGGDNGKVLETKTLILSEFKFENTVWDSVTVGGVALELIKDELQLGDEWQITVSDNNWVMPERPIRLSMSLDFVNSKLISDEPIADVLLRTLTENKNATEKFIFQTEKTVVAYFKEVLESDSGVLVPYIQSGDIIVENLT